MEKEKGEDPTFHDIPLEEVVVRPALATPEPAAEPDLLYKSLMGKAIQTIIRLASLPPSRWKLYNTTPHRTRIGALFELEDDTAPTFCSLKATAVIQGRAERYAHILSDHDPIVRMPWDSANFSLVRHCETFRAPEGDIDVVQARLNIGGFFLQGIQSRDYDPDLKTHKYYFCTATNPRHAPPPGAGPIVDLLYGVFVRQLDGEQCEVTIVTNAKVEGRFAMLPEVFVRGYKELVLDRIFVLEGVVREWGKYYGKERDPKKKRW